MLPFNRIVDIDAIIEQPKKLALLAIQKIRRTLERGFSPEWRNEQFMHILLYFLKCDGNEALQMEASWIFTNIAAGSYEQTKWIVDRGVVPQQMRLLESPSEEVVEQSIWTLGNVMGDSGELRDLVISHGLIPRLLAIDIDSKSIVFRRTFIWVIVNIVRCKDPQIPLEDAKSLVPVINRFLQGFDTTTKIDALWALTYIADCNEPYIQIVIDSGIIPTIVPMLSNHRFKLQLAAMRMLGNIATGTDAQTNVLLTNDILVQIRFPLMHPKENLRRMALWCLSNITTGSTDQVQAVFNSGLLSRIVENLTREEIKTRREALITIRNMINSGSLEQILEIINVGAINPLFQLLNVVDDLTYACAVMAKSSLEAIFKKANQLVQFNFMQRISVD